MNLQSPENFACSDNVVCRERPQTTIEHQYRNNGAHRVGAALVAAL